MGGEEREGGEEGEGCPCGVFELAKSCRCQFAEPKLTTSTNHYRVKTIFTSLIFKHFLQQSLNDCDPTPVLCLHAKWRVLNSEAFPWSRIDGSEMKSANFAKFIS